ncbi:MAG TPA: hypothetical protein EYQ61_04265 [Dehalococcoidia bacterium]|jgi:hypothetical protein|nr:hypothetical protein [Dehalococcoidia bacterium]HIK89356.1 hypothetical protein [Dehalococcoidia bacterium]
MNWKVLTTAPDQLIAESWCGLIRSAGIDCKLQPGDAVGFMGVSVFPVRIMVDASDVEIAQSVLDTYIAPDEIEEQPDQESDPELT